MAKKDQKRSLSGAYGQALIAVLGAALPAIFVVVVTDLYRYFTRKKENGNEW